MFDELWRSLWVEDADELVQRAVPDSFHFAIAPIKAVGDPSPGLEAVLGNAHQVHRIFRIVNSFSLPSALVADPERFGLQIQADDEKPLVMLSEVDFHFGDSLVLGAEEQPKLLPSYICGDLEGLAGSDGVLLVEGHLMRQLARVLDVLLEEQVEVDLPRPEEIVLVLAVPEPPHHQAEQLLPLPVVLEQDHRPVTLPLQDTGLLHEPQLLPAYLIDQTLEARLCLFLLVPENQQVVLPLVPELSQLDQHQSAPDADRVEVFQDQPPVVDAVQRYAFLLYCCN